MRFYVCGFETNSLGMKVFFNRNFDSKEEAEKYIKKLNEDAFFVLIEGTSLYSGNAKDY